MVKYYYTMYVTKQENSAYMEAIVLYQGYDKQKALKAKNGHNLQNIEIWEFELPKKIKDCRSKDIIEAPYNIF